MSKQFIYIIFIIATINCYGQEIKNERQISIGAYGMVHPSRNKTIFFAGALLDVSLKKHKRLYSSSSINYAGFNYYTNKQYISISSGISWSLQKNHFCFRPSIQIGYLYINREKSSVDYLFHGGFGRLSTELTYVAKRFEYGIQFNLGMGYGPTRYYYSDKIINQNLFGIMGGYGLEVKYNLFK